MEINQVKLEKVEPETVNCVQIEFNTPNVDITSGVREDLQTNGIKIEPEDDLYLKNINFSNTFDNKNKKNHKNSNHRPVKSRTPKSKSKKFLDRNFDCALCPKKYLRKHHLQAHVLSAHKTKRMFECDQCDKAYKNKTSLMEHKQIHRRLDPRPFKCDLCDKCYELKKCLKTHIEGTHTEQLPFKCEECDYTSKLRSSMINHRNSHRKPFQCEFCDKTFAAMANVKRHATAVHSNIRDVPCDICGKMFANRHYVQKHFKRHHAYITKLEPTQPANVPKLLKIESVKAQGAVVFAEKDMNDIQVNSTMPEEVTENDDCNESLHQPFIKIETEEITENVNEQPSVELEPGCHDQNVINLQNMTTKPETVIDQAVVIKESVKVEQDYKPTIKVEQC